MPVQTPCCLQILHQQEEGDVFSEPATGKEIFGASSTYLSDSLSSPPPLNAILWYNLNKGTETNSFTA